jgi:hypothetical protein
MQTGGLLSWREPFLAGVLADQPSTMPLQDRLNPTQGFTRCTIALARADLADPSWNCRWMP